IVLDGPPVEPGQPAGDEHVGPDARQAAVRAVEVAVHHELHRSPPGGPGGPGPAVAQGLVEVRWSRRTRAPDRSRSRVAVSRTTGRVRATSRRRVTASAAGGRASSTR